MYIHMYVYTCNCTNNTDQLHGKPRSTGEQHKPRSIGEASRNFGLRDA